MRNVNVRYMNCSLMLLTTAAVLSAQTADTEPKFEFGGGVVGSFYDKKALTSTSGNADAGFDPGFGASGWIGHHMYPKVSGELRYDYLRNDMILKGSAASASFGAESHAVHYDVHYHFAEKGAKVRPFVLAGGGVKVYRGTGQERAFQALSQIAVLTKTSEAAGLLTFGVGVKVQLNERCLLRLEFRDNLTRFPKKVIAPNRGSGASGWVNNFAPTAGLSLLF